MITDSKKWLYVALKNERTSDGEKWHNRAVTSLSRLLSRITSNHHGDFYCLNLSFIQHRKLKKQEKVCNDHGYCYTEMPKGDKKILKYNHNLY